MPKLLNRSQFHKITRVFAFDCSWYADIYHKIFPNLLQILGIRYKDIFELQRIILYYGFFFLVAVHINLCAIFVKRQSILIEGAIFSQLQCRK